MRLDELPDRIERVLRDLQQLGGGRMIQLLLIVFAFFKTLDSRNRYAVLFRIQNAKKRETRAARIARFVGMLERHEKIYP